MAWWLFQNLIVTAALATLVAIVCRTTRINPVSRHALWVLVLVKFVTPPVFVWPWAVPDPLGLATVAAPARAADTIVAPESRFSSSTAPDANVADAGKNPASIDRSDSPQNSVPAPSLAPIATASLPWLLTLWAAGSFCVLVVEGRRLVRLARVVRVATPGPPAIVERAAVLAARLGLRVIPIVEIRGYASPAVWCVGRPRLLWPSDLPADSTAACIDGLLVHELAHVQRRDHFVGWIELVAGVIWWWNPLFWYVRSSLREQAELACDAWVISALPNGRRAYAESLLALSSAGVQGRSPAMATVIGIRANNRRVLERRLVMIMQGRASRRLSVAGLVGVGVMALATLPAWATSSQQTTTPSTPVVAAPAQAPTPATPQTARPVTAPTPAASTPQTAQPTTPAVAVPSRPTAIAPIHPVTAAPMHPVGVAPAPAHAAIAPISAEHAQSVPVRPVTVPATHPTPFTPMTHATTAAQRVAPLPAKTVDQVQAARVWDQALQGWTVQDPQGRAVTRSANLPAEGQQLREKFDADREVIQQEADKKVEARRAEFVKSLQALQDQYAKAGKLDEAVAIRDYIKAVESGLDRRVFIRKR